MKKYRTEVRSFADLRPGDLIGTPYGFARLAHVQNGEEVVTLHLENQKPISCHPSSWPEVAVGFTDEYQAAYPDQRFGDLPEGVRPIQWHCVSAIVQASQMCRYCQDRASFMRKQGKQGWIPLCTSHAYRPKRSRKR